MGDAAVSALVKEVVMKLSHVALQEFDLLWGLKDNVLNLKKDFEHIEAVIQDAEENHTKERAVELWLRDLRSASLMVENVLDEVSTDVLLQRLHKKRGIKHMVRAFFSSDYNQAISCVRIAHKVKHIRRKLDAIAIASKRFELKVTPPGAINSHVDVDKDVDVAGEMPDRETTSVVHSSVIFGRNEEMKMVINKICNEDLGKYNDREIRVYGIWGMGGLGKTTLAQLVYNHERVNQYFDLKSWIYVSEKFQVKEIIRKIIESIDNCGCTLTLLDKLQESLQKKLGGKKFLIVLDDVWIEDEEKAKWDDLSQTLSCGAEGSIVVLTTRSQKTSRMMAKVPEWQHKLGCLSVDDSWLLFEKLAFAEGREEGDISELKPIGREIVEKCKGLPLALKTLGSLMWSKSSTSDWQYVKDNNIWELNEVLPAILKLSYDNLLPYLKRCFAYCCLFPKGHNMKKDVVIQLWVVNGFIPLKEGKNMYMLGEDIFDCLVWRSFFQFVKGDVHNSDSYKMHDLIHDMARHVMRYDCLVIEDEGKEVKIPKEVLHLSSVCPNLLFSHEELRNITSLRSILMLGRINEGRISEIFNHVYLRVLYLDGSGLKTVPESICKLKHLRFLNLSFSFIEFLPWSIIHLQNLQVLLLHKCQFLCKLPKGLKYLTNLQCLDVSCCGSLLHMPLGIKELTSLRRLSRFHVGDKSGAKIGELTDMNLLEGELEISGLANVGGLNEAKSVNLKCKINLSILKLRWMSMCDRHDAPKCKQEEEVMEGLEPNRGLKELEISFHLGRIFPTWMVSLRNLVKIKFYVCHNYECISSIGILPNLRVITLWAMFSLKRFHENDRNTTSNMFLSLQELYIFDCPSLVSLPANLPNIRSLHLHTCGSLLSLPDEIQSFKYLSELKITYCIHLSKRYKVGVGEDWPKISHIPDIKIYDF